MRKGDRCVLTQILKHELKIRLSRFKITQRTRGGEYEKMQKRFPDSDFLCIFLKKPSHLERVMFYLTQPMSQVVISCERAFQLFLGSTDHATEIRYCLADPSTDPDLLCARLANHIVNETYRDMSRILDRKRHISGPA